MGPRLDDVRKIYMCGAHLGGRVDLRSTLPICLEEVEGLPTYLSTHALRRVDLGVACPTRREIDHK